MQTMRKRYTVKDVFRLVLVLVLVLVTIYIGLQILESRVLYPAQNVPGQTATKTILRDGTEYFPRQDITVVMVLGIDQSGPVQSSNYYRNEGSADCVVLLIFDETEKNCRALYLNRDTMLNMDVLGVRGEYAGTTYGQLALAHTYGSGLADSCENVKNTLMKFLHGLSVDYYVAMNMDAIPILNDAVGGVTVTVKEDFSNVNPDITMGELKLQGEQAVDYVRTRKDVGDQSNVTRMERQKEYVDGFLKALVQKEQENADFVLRVYEQVEPYMVTDCSATTLNHMVDRYGKYTLGTVVTPEGENLVAEGHWQFHVDEEALDQLVLELFYAPK